MVNTTYTRAMYEATHHYMQPATEYQQLTGNGTVDLDKLHCRLNAAAGAYSVALPNGNEEHEEQWILFVGTGGTFNVSGTFRGFTSLQLEVLADSALLKWIAGKWTFVAGTARQL